MGYDVQVIHLNYILPHIFQYVGKLINVFCKTNNWSVNFLNSTRKNMKYDIESIPVSYIPVIRPIPRHSVPQWHNQIAYKNVIRILKEENYNPDIIVGHWSSPLFFIHKLKSLFPDAKTGLVLHQRIGFSNRIDEKIQILDAIGFRNEAIRKSFEALYGRHDNEFICYSGVPQVYLSNNPKSFSSTISRFVYVGKLMELKRVENSIIALDRVYGERDFHFDIVGDGVCYEDLKSLTEKLNLHNKVTFHGNVSRDRAQEIVGNAECFVMVSDYEAFGLVYLEAMAKGLITIGTKGQGADGFIIDGKNGFLCEPKNIDALCDVLRIVLTMSNEELNNISRNALNTATEMTDKKVAEKYINRINY